MDLKAFLLFPMFYSLHSFPESSACFGGGFGGCGVNPWCGLGGFGWGGGGGGVFGAGDLAFGFGGYPAYPPPVIGAYPYSTSKFLNIQIINNNFQKFNIDIATGFYAAAPMPIISSCCPFTEIIGFKKRRKRYTNRYISIDY